MLRAPRWALALVAGTALAVVGAGIALLVIASGGSGGSGSGTATAAQLTAYTRALRGPTAQGGQVVAQEMKPSISDVSSGAVDGTTLIRRAQSWKIAFARVRSRIDAIAVPPGLHNAQHLFDAAIDGYARVADLLSQAGAATGDARSHLIDDAIAAGRQADATYDRAAAMVQAALRAVGLSPDVDLPDPTPS